MRDFIRRLAFWLYRLTSPALIAGAEAQPTETPPASSAGISSGESGGEGGEPTAAPDLSALTSRMEEVATSVGQLAQRIPERAPEDELYGGTDPYGQPQQPQQEFDAYGNPIQPGQEQAYWDPSQMDPQDPAVQAQILQAEIQRQVAAGIQPHIESQMQQQREAEGLALLDDYPELADPAASQALHQDALGWAQDILRTVPGSSPQLAQQLAGEPGFIELVHLAAKTAERAGEETPAGQAQAEVTLESGGAANAGPGTGSQPLGQAIKDAGRPAETRFWTG